MNWTWYLFRFEGRINRAKLWLAMLVILCWMMFLAGLTFATGIVSGGASFGFSLDDLFRVVDPATYRSWSWAGLPYLLVKAVGTSLFLWVYFATSFKRLHDRDKSGWWIVPFFVIPGLYNRFLFHPAAGPRGAGPVPLGFCRNVLPERLAEDQPVRRRPAGAAGHHGAALGPAKRDRNDTAQGWPAAGLAC